VLLAYEMGLGKTLMSLWWIGARRDRLPAVVVCPAVVKYQWEVECKRALHATPVVLSGRKARPLGYCDLAIINYDVLDCWIEELRRMRPRTVVLDECHYVKNPKAKRTKAARRLCYKVPNILALSGTPLLNKPIELWPILNILYPAIWRSRWHFAHRYCGPQLTPWGWKFDGATRVKELHKKLTDTCMVRRRKAEVIEDLPHKTRCVVPIELDDAARREYERARLDFIAWLRERDPQAALRAKRAESITKLSYLLQLIAKHKANFVASWINDWLQESDGKLAVFVRHHEMTDTLVAACKEAVVIDGRETQAKRQAALRAFKEGPNRVLIGSIDVAGVGLNLQDVCNTVAFVELSFRPADHLQAEDRVHRIGSTAPVWVYYLIARDTLEEKLCRIIQSKQSTISSVLDGDEDVSGLDVFDQLLKEVYDDNS